MSEQVLERKNLTVATVLPVELKNLVAGTARVYGMTSSEVVRRAIEAYFDDRPDVVAAVTDMPPLPSL